jgi:hypothetical protein
MERREQAKLRRLFIELPRPTIEEMARAFGTTESAIQTPASRCGYALMEHRNALHPQYQKPGATVGHSERDCMIWTRPLFGEGSHNRQCPRCYEANGEMAA